MVVSALVIEKTGRKMLLSLGYGIMVVCMVLIIIILKLELTSSIAVPYAAIVGYIIGFSIGPGPITWIYNTEFFDQKTRGSAAIIACAVLKIMNETV